MVASGGCVSVDVRQDQPGRGAYVHPTQACLDKAVARRMFGRALRAEVDTAQAAATIRASISQVA